jgi:hypothetical protein
MKFSFISLVFILTSSCQNQSLETRYYPSDQLYFNERIVRINLDSIDLNFKEITDSMIQLESENGKVVFEINDNGILKRIMPNDNFIFGIIKSKNIFDVRFDSVHYMGWHHIDNLKIILKKHFMNKGIDPNFSDSPEKTIVQVTLDTTRTANDLKSLLINLTQTFDEINTEVKDSLELRLKFYYFPEILPKPSITDIIKIDESEDE